MKTIKNLAGKKVTLRFVLYPVLCLILSLGILCLAVMIQPNSFRYMLQCFFQQPMLFVLNLLPVYLVLLCAAYLVRNVLWGASITTLLFCGFSLANRVKISVRDEPLYPRDVILLREVGDAVRSYDISFPWKIIVVALLIVFALFALGYLFKSPVHTTKLKTWLIQIFGVVISGTLLFVATLTVYSSDDIYYSFDTTNMFHTAVCYNEYGFPYSFFHHLTSYAVDEPDGFDLDQAMAWDENAESPSDGKQVHVIMVMNEAFSALSEYEAFSYDDSTDPLKNYHSLQKDEHAISGYTVVANLGGGTANTEFDVLTGMQTDALSATTTIAFGAVAKNVDSLFRVFSQDGYDVSFVHPGDDWFYNRVNIYPRLGCDSNTFLDDIESPEIKGNWVSDAYTTKMIIDSFESAVAQDELVFSYITTVQNHMSYTENKYGKGYPLQELPITIPVSEESNTMLKVYMTGLRDADAMLGSLVEYFSVVNEPVILVFFGDHMPNLGSNNNGYTDLGIPIDSNSTDVSTRYYAYSTPYIIWTNDVGAEVLDWETAKSILDLPDNGHLSACYLGAMLLELTGRGDSTSWFSFLNQLRRQFPVVKDGSYADCDGQVYTTLNDTQQGLIDQWRKWSYYKLKYKVIP